MALKIGYEHGMGGSWKMMEQKTTDHWKAITVGQKDFLMHGKQSEIVRWLLVHKHLSLKTYKGFGDKAYIVLRGIAAKPSEELLKAYGGAIIGVGGIASGISFCFDMALGTEVSSAVHGLLTNPSDFNVDNAVGKLFSPKVHVHFSCAKGAYSGHKDSVVSVDSGSNLEIVAGALSQLRW